MHRRTARVAPLLFGSGLCALLYQIAWLREFRLIFGASTAASAAVVAIFIGGLGTGGLLLGRRIDRHRNPLALYAQLEIAVAATVMLTPGLLWAARGAYLQLGGSAGMGLPLASLVRLLLAAAVLALPTLLMGGTLPAAVRAVEREEDLGRRSTAWLYGINTLGAVVGCLLGNFALLEILGTRRTIWCACLVNGLVALVARRMARTAAPPGDREGGGVRTALPPGADRADNLGAGDLAAGEVGLGRPGAPGGEGDAAGTAGPPAQQGPSIPVASGGALAPPRLVLVAAAVVGMAFFLMELVWYRMLGPLLGGTVFTFGLILAVALTGIGLGGALYGALARDRRPGLGLFALSCLAEALCMAVPYALGDRIALLALLTRPLGNLGFAGHVLSWSLVAGLVILPAALVAGAQFPLLVALLGTGQRHVGVQLGQAYACNTAGAITGSLAGGFGLLPLLGAEGAWQAACLALAGLGVAAAGWQARQSRRAGPLLGATGAALATGALFALAEGPTAAWRHSPIGAGRVPLEEVASPNQIRDWLARRRRDIVWQAEGVESSVALASRAGAAFVVNGKVDGHAVADGPTQVMSGLVGALLHPAPARALVIGLGTGSTAGWLAEVPGMQRVDVVELEPAIRHVARTCAAVNHDVLAHPRVRLVIGDAREFLLTTGDRYDIIFSEPSNPYRAGIASLFTREYYEAAAARMDEEDLFLQWVQAYEIDGQTVRTIYATMAAVFPHIDTWHLGTSDLMLVASRRPVVHDLGRLRQRVASYPFATALANTWRTVGVEGLLARFLARSELAQAVAVAEGDRINTDDHNLVEFGFARGVGGENTVTVERIRAVARARGIDRPVVTGGAIDVERLELERGLVFAGEQQSPPRGAVGLSAAGQQVMSALAAYGAGDLAAALAAYRASGLAPRTPAEFGLLAHAAAMRGDPEYARYTAGLRRFVAPEADALEALALVHRQQPEAALAAFERAFAGYRRHPWPLMRHMDLAVRAAQDLGLRNPALAERIHRALRQPFLLWGVDDLRRWAVSSLAEVLPASLCVDAVQAAEPHPPWNGAYLLLRSECFERAGHPQRAAAAQALQEFVDRAPAAFEQQLAAPGAAADPAAHR